MPALEPQELRTLAKQGLIFGAMHFVGLDLLLVYVSLLLNLYHKRYENLDSFFSILRRIQQPIFGNQ